MELKHLRTFVAAAEEANFTRAAESLQITQAAVSQHIAALEHGLKVELFDRTRRAITLTDAGRCLCTYARRLLALVEEARLAVSGVESLIEGHIRIAASTVPGEHLLPKLLAKFRDEFPAVHEAVHITDSRLAAKAVADGEADVGFVGEKPHSYRLVAEPIAADKLVLVVAADHECARKRFITVRSLLKQKLIMREPGSGSRNCVEASLRLKGIAIDELDIVLEVNSNDAIRTAVCENVGAAFLSSMTVSGELKSGVLNGVDIRGVQPTRQLYLVHKPESLQSPATRAFVESVIAQCAEPA